MGEREGQRIRQYLNEGENLVAYVKGSEGRGKWTVALVLLFGILSTLVGKSVYLIVTDKRLLIAPVSGGETQSFQLSELESVKYHIGMSWLSSFLYPAWITIKAPNDTQLHVNLVGGAARKQGKELVSKVL
jgi:hypothetical protein